MSTWVSADAATPPTAVVPNQLQRRQPSTSHEMSRPDRCSLRRRSLRVLVVDSNHEMANGRGWWLHRRGHNPRVAYDGHTALRLAAKYQPHLVLLNLEMPQMDGCHVAKQLRLDFPRSQCFIIGITWRADVERRIQSIAAGIDLLLIKPIDLFLVETLLPMEMVGSQQLLAKSKATRIINHDLILKQ